MLKDWWQQVRDYAYSPLGRASRKDILRDEIIYANHVRRVLSCLLDLVLVNVVSDLVVCRAFGMDLNTMLELMNNTVAGQLSGFPPMVIFCLMLVCCLYYTVSWILPWQATLGQAIMGIAVVSISNRQGKLKVFQAFCRLFASWLSISSVVGLLPIMVTPQRMALHDMLCDTRMVCLYPTKLDKELDLSEKLVRKLWKWLANIGDKIYGMFRNKR